MWRKPNEDKLSEPLAAPVPFKSEEPVKPQSPQAPQVPSSFAAPSMTSSPAPSSPSLSKISAGLKIQGELSGDTDLYIDGSVQGKVRMMNGRVTVGPNGRVQAEIEARQISIDGTVEGNLKASESAQFGSSSKVVGSVMSPRVGVADGARLRGKIETIRTPQTPKPTAAKGAAMEDEAETIGSKVE